MNKQSIYNVLLGELIEWSQKHDFTKGNAIALWKNIYRNNVKNFDEQQYCKQWNHFSVAVGLVFDGKASCKLADAVEVELR